MKPHLKKYHAEYWSSDIKPSGKMSRYLNKSERQRAKKEIQEEVEEEMPLVDEIMLAQFLAREDW